MFFIDEREREKFCRIFSDDYVDDDWFKGKVFFNFKKFLDKGKLLIMEYFIIDNVRFIFFSVWFVLYGYKSGWKY